MEGKICCLNLMFCINVREFEFMSQVKNGRQVGEWQSSLPSYLSLPYPPQPFKNAHRLQVLKIKPFTFIVINQVLTNGVHQQKVFNFCFHMFISFHCKNTRQVISKLQEVGEIIGSRQVGKWVHKQVGRWVGLMKSSIRES